MDDDYKALRPLTSQVNDINRGNEEVIGPKTRGKGPKGTTLIAGFHPNCVRGELIGVVLGLCRVDEPADLTGITNQGYYLPAVRAHLWWGLGGVTFNATCDYIHGTVVGLVAEGVRVCAEYVCWKRSIPDDLLPPKTCLPCYKVKAGFGYGARNYNSNPARLTEFVVVKTAGDTERIEIPPFAISVTVQPIGTSSVSIDVLGYCEKPIVHYDIATPLTNAGQHNVENALPLYNGAVYIDVKNENESEPLEAFVIFGLAL